MSDETNVPKEENESTPIPIEEEDLVDPEPKPEIKEGEVDIQKLPTHKEILEDDDENAIDMLTPALPVCTATEAADYIKYLKDKLTDAQFADQLLDPKSPLSTLRKIIDNATAMDDYNRDRLTGVVNDLKQKYSDVENGIKLTDASPVSNADLKGKVISGEEAKLMMLAKDRNVRRVYLYNSGFDVTLKGPSLDELNIYYNKVSSEVAEYGKEFGSHFYLFSDIIIKKATVDLFMQLITHASLKNWKRGNTLLKSLMLPDYDVISWTIGTLMNQKGFPFSFLCVNPDNSCGYGEDMEIDLKNIRFNNYSLIPPEAMKMLCANTVKTKKDLDTYHKILNLSRKIKFSSKYIARTKVASFHDYFEYGSKFNSSLIEHVQLEDRANLYRHLNFNYYKIFAPWISEIQYLNDDGTVNFRLQDLDSIVTALDTRQLEDTTFGDDIEQFIKDITITHICIPFSGCPKCQYVPTYAKDGYLPFDVQQNFFIQTVMRLAQ